MIFNEVKFKTFVQPHMLRCRDGDWNHARRVVSWVKKLGQGRKDLYILITAAYIHDIGWRDVLPKGKITFSKLLNYEHKANSNSKSFVENILKELKYSQADIIKINRLIKAADVHNSDNDDEVILVDSDNLSKLTINHLKEKFERKEWNKMYNLWRKEMPKRLKTKNALVLYSGLLQKLKKDIDKFSD